MRTSERDGSDGESTSGARRAATIDEPVVQAPAWGTSYGLDALPDMPGDACDADTDGSGAGPAFDAVARIAEAIGDLQELLSCHQVPAADLAELTVLLNTIDNRIEATHLAALEQVRACDAIPPGPATVASWLSFSHNMTGNRAGMLRHTASWLDAHPLTAEALAAGHISLAHVTVLRQVSERNEARRAAFIDHEPIFVELAHRADPSVLARAMNAWADNLDPDPADADADAAYARRRFYLSPLADGWELGGHLPDVLGAELAGIINELMSKALRDAPEGQPLEAASARRADALMDLARAASASGLTDGAKGRAATTVTVPVHRLHTCHDCGGHHHAPGTSCDGPGCALWRGHPADSPTTAAAASWAVGNGPGQGFLASCQAEWLTCDGEITRLIVDPESRPLDVGRTARVVSASIRRALVERDAGCVIPGCDRPVGWCEAHHLQHWAQGGLTAVSNMVLLCSRHHHELHLGHWRISLVEGKADVHYVPEGRRSAERRERRHHYRHLGAE